MTQLHKRFTDGQVRVLLNGYCQGLLARAEIQEMLDIGKTRFFALLKEYRKSPEAFSVAYERHTPGRLPAAVEVEIERELLREKAIVEDKRLPISGYNYSALRDRLKKKGIKVSATTIIDRAKRLDCYKPRKKRKTHDREVLTGLHRGSGSTRLLAAPMVSLRSREVGLDHLHRRLQSDATVR